jgi:trehalose-6-phosphate synthase
MALALRMPEQERRQRMEQMRRQVTEHNVYRWGGEIVSDILQLQLLHPPVRQPAPSSRVVAHV